MEMLIEVKITIILFFQGPLICNNSHTVIIIQPLPSKPGRRARTPPLSEINLTLLPYLSSARSRSRASAVPLGPSIGSEVGEDLNSVAGSVKRA